MCDNINCLENSLCNGNCTYTQPLIKRKLRKVKRKKREPIKLSERELKLNNMMTNSKVIMTCGRSNSCVECNVCCPEKAKYV